MVRNFVPEYQSTRYYGKETSFAEQNGDYTPNLISGYTGTIRRAEPSEPAPDAVIDPQVIYSLLPQNSSPSIQTFNFGKQPLASLNFNCEYDDFQEFFPFAKFTMEDPMSSAGLLHQTSVSITDLPNIPYEEPRPEPVL